MAPAIAHFLIGAGLTLCLVAPISLRYDLEPQWGVWLILLGGIWGLLPDIHNIAPVYREQLYALHGLPLMDLFAFHYLLDRPTIRAHYLESVFVSILFFLFALVIFSIVQPFRERLVAATAAFEYVVVVAITLVATGYGTSVLSVLVLNVGRYDALAALISREGLVVGWLVLVVLSAAVGAMLMIGFEWFGPSRFRTEPLYGFAVAGFVALFGWLLASIVIPIWFQLVSDGTVRFPYIEWMIPLALGAFAVTFAFVYTLVRGASVSA